MRGQYFWHRFFSHQPDLNFENPKVQDAMIEVLKFWLDLGIDGFRLDAVPYLYEREGTNCENLKETHEYLKRIRTEIDAAYPDRVLLAEANQWPADVVEYFGDPETGGNECHMAFHFPLMPRIFMAVRREQRYPISEILAQTPKIPGGCQWGIFLRNHDELTLEMVTDEERDYMYKEYAKDPRMKANIGIRRRLAPLLDNDRNQLELFTALLLSLPGSPVHVLRRRDRHGRQHLARRPGRRAHPDAVDAGPQRRVLEQRPAAALPAAGHGPDLRLPVAQRRGPAAPPAVAAALDQADDRDQEAAPGLRPRRVRGAQLRPTRACWLSSGSTTRRDQPRSEARDRGARLGSLCVNNLSRFPQPVELDLRRFIGVTPVECMGGVTFPPIGELPYLLTLPGHGFYWFQLPPAREEHDR